MKNGLVKAINPVYTGLLSAIVGWQLFGVIPPVAGALKPSHKNDPGPASQTKGPSASQPPAWSIPVEPLGFYAPGPYYLGQREALVSLDFLDENRLLFTFRAPGLIRRSNTLESERQIRAEVLNLPQGSIETESLWTLHDHDRYLWMLRGGHFLLRDQNSIREGDSKLVLRPLLQFPGPLISLAMDPDQQYLVTNSVEPASVQSQKGQVQSPATAQTSVSTDDAGEAEKRDIVLRILDRASGQVMLVSRVRSPVRVPINDEGYIETLPGSNQDWVLNFDAFRGDNRILGRVNSSCQPPIEFVARDKALINTCLFQNGRKLIAMSTEGQRLWEAASPATQIWPILVRAPDGSRVARETLTVSHSIEGFGHAFDPQDIKSQLVEIFDTAAGKLLLQASANPVLDGGGNLAFSPSGKRVAILNGGAIEIYELTDRPASSNSKPSGDQAPR